MTQASLPGTDFPGTTPVSIQYRVKAAAINLEPEAAAAAAGPQQHELGQSYVATANVVLVYSAFHLRSRFDDVFATARGISNVSGAVGCKPVTVRIWETTFNPAGSSSPPPTNMSGGGSGVTVDWLPAPAPVAANPAIPTDVSFRTKHYIYIANNLQYPQKHVTQPIFKITLEFNQFEIQKSGIFWLKFEII